MHYFLMNNFGIFLLRFKENHDSAIWSGNSRIWSGNVAWTEHRNIALQCAGRKNPKVELKWVYGASSHRKISDTFDESVRV